MLERHQAHTERVWDVNSLWLTFLFLCLCWVAVMVLIIHREVLNQTNLQNLFQERAEVRVQMVALEDSETQSAEYADLRARLDSIESRIAAAEMPPTALYMVFSAFEGLFIAAYFVLLWQLRRQIKTFLLLVYLATLPLGFIYFFLFITLGSYHTWSQLFSEASTAVVAAYFLGGLVLVGGHAILWGERRSSASTAPQ